MIEILTIATAFVVDPAFAFAWPMDMRPQIFGAPSISFRPNGQNAGKRANSAPTDIYFKFAW